MENVKDQVITEDYAIYNGDCMHVLPSLPSKSIDLSVYSPPFAGLYNYSSSENDFSNCETKEQFMQQYEFLIEEISRVTKPGRITAVHCCEIVNQNGSNWDFPNEIMKLHEKHGFYYKNRITIWKEPLKVRMRTMVMSLMHKLIVEDSTRCFTAMPDYILIFKKKGENEIPVTHPKGLTYYAGEIPMLPAMVETYGSFEDLKKKFAGHLDPKTNKLSHIIWQRYASSVWDDIRIDNVLQYKESKDEDDEKHVHPLQLDVIDRLVELYSNPGELILTPFMGVGSEVYSAVKWGRKAIGIELKDTYFKQSIKNLAELKVIKIEEKKIDFDNPDIDTEVGCLRD
jgi:DNA modification methylase